MAIEEYGASLLSDVRRRQDKQAKQMRKEQEQTALMGLGLGLGVQVGNEYLRNKAQSFFNNEDTLKKRTEFKSMYRAAERTLEERQQYEKMGENYFLQQALTEISEPLKAAAGLNYDPDKFTAVQYTLAQKRAQELKANYEKTVEAADKFVASAGADPEAYNKALLSTRPKSIGEAVRMSVGNYFGGDDNAMHNANLNTLDTSLGRYREAYAQTKNPWASRTVAQLFEDFKDFDFGSAPLKIEESKNIKIPDGMGGTTEQTALVVTQAGQIVSFVDPTTRKPIVQPVAGDNARIKRQRLPESVVEGTRQSLLSLLDVNSGAGKTISTYYTTQSGSDPKNTDRIKGAKNDIYGGIYDTSEAVKKRMPVRNDVALLISAEMHAMNIENTTEKETFFGVTFGEKKVPQYNLLATRDSFSPILALAALERIEKKETGSQIGINERTIANLRAGILRNTTDADYMESFGDLSLASKLYTLRWMKDYDTFNRPINNAGETIISRLMSTYDLQGKI
jgi:hypothetical protein